MFRPYSTFAKASIRSYLPSRSVISRPRVHRTSHLPLWKYYSTANNMSDLFVELTAPNGRKYRQPRGLFINNEFVKSKSGETIASINPRHAYPYYLLHPLSTTNGQVAMRKRLLPSTQLAQKMSTMPWQQRGRHSTTHLGGTWTPMIALTCCSSLHN